MDRRAAPVDHAVAVLADAVHAHHVALVFDGAGAQQRVPVGLARRRPVGRIEEHVVVAPVAGPHREAQVVADQRTHAPAAVGDDDPRVPGVVVLVFAGHAEAVALVVRRRVAVRRHPDQPVEPPLAVPDHHAAHQDHAERGRAVAQPGHGRPVHGFGDLPGIHREAGAEHLGQDDEVRVGLDPLEPSIEAPPVRGWIVPVEGALDDGDLHGRLFTIRSSQPALHKRQRISAARSSVSSSFAKQNRRKRWFGGSA